MKIHNSAILEAVLNLNGVCEYSKKEMSSYEISTF